MLLGVPEPVRRKALLAGADDWLDALPDLVSAIAGEWRLRVGPAFGDSTEALVLAVTEASGQPVVLKLIVPRDGDAARHEIATLQRAAGDGCVRLQRHDVGRGALLLERLGPSLHELGLPVRERQAILADLAARVWRPAADLGLPTGAQKGRWLIDFICATWESLHRPLPLGVVEHALACARRRIAAHDDARARLVHGDVHEWNALRTPDGFALVDPDGLLPEPEYDLGVLMREDPVELLVDGSWERAPAGRPHRPRRDRDLGVGRRRAGLDRVAADLDRGRAGRRSDAGDGARGGAERAVTARTVGVVEDLRAARAVALEQVADRRRELDDVLASASSTTGDDEHDPEGATIGFERAQAQSMLDRALAQVTELDAAIARSEAGGYGVCIVCGRPIGAERLAARPATRFCITHAR